MSQHHLCPCAEACYLQAALSAIGGKWKLPILCSLTANGASRYNDLLRNVRGVSNTMLSKTLHEMENDGLVRRTEYLEVPVRVEYELTDIGREFGQVLESIEVWGNKYIEYLNK